MLRIPDPSILAGTKLAQVQHEQQDAALSTKTHEKAKASRSFREQGSPHILDSIPRNFGVAWALFLEAAQYDEVS